MDKKKERNITLVACGDIGLYSKLEQKLLQEGSLSILGDSVSIFNGAEIVFGNLEGPVSDRGVGAALSLPYPSLRMHPKAIDFLKEAGFNVLSVANNHMLDYGDQALLDTIHRLEQAGILYFGAGKNESDAGKPRILKSEGIKIGFVGFHEGGAVAKPDSPGSCEFTIKKAREAIRGLRNHTDFIIVSFHFGFDYFTCPSPYHTSVCRRLIDEGADLILGHHPHVPQGIEEYKNGLISYSLGNFAFYLANNPPNGTTEGFILKLKIGKAGIQNWEILPYHLRPELRLHILKGIEREKKLSEYELLSKRLKDASALRKNWYECVRNYYLGYIIFYWKFDFQNRNILKFIQRIAKLFKASGPNLIILKSLLGFIFSGYLLKAETIKIISKVKNRIG